jgi:Flp pilus assembly protein TadG
MLHRVRKVRITRGMLGRGCRTHKARGQSLVEFALVSIILFLLLIGLFEFGRLLFVYSVVTNAAQEGSRFGIVRPREVYSASEAATRVAMGTAIPTQLVVADGQCNVVDKAREKVWGVRKADLQISVWYDDGGGTPTPVTGSNLEAVVIAGNRIVVESRYRFRFLTPLISDFAPGGIDVRMSSARTLLTNGGGNRPPCSFQYSVAPTPTTTPTVPPPTPTRTNTPTVTPTSTASPTPTPRALVLASVLVYKETGSSKPINARVYVTDNGNPASPQSGVSVQVTVYDCSGSTCVPYGPYTLPELSGAPGYYKGCPVTGQTFSGDPAKFRLYVKATKSGYLQAEGTYWVASGSTCPSNP